MLTGLALSYIGFALMPLSFAGRRVNPWLCAAGMLLSAGAVCCMWLELLCGPCK